MKKIFYFLDFFKKISRIIKEDGAYRGRKSLFYFILVAFFSIISLFLLKIIIGNDSFLLLILCGCFMLAFAVSAVIYLIIQLTMVICCFIGLFKTGPKKGNVIGLVFGLLSFAVVALGAYLIL